MKEVKNDRKTRYTRKALRDSLMELMKEKPFSKITIKELCENADINRTTFYIHYTDQLDLLRHIEDETLSWAKETVHSIMEHNASREMIGYLESVFQFFLDNKELSILMGLQGEQSFQRLLFTTIYEQCNIAPSSNKSPAARELYIIFIINGTIGLIQHWIQSGFQQSPKELAMIVLQMAKQIQ